MWDGERPKQSLEDPKAIELAWWGRGAGVFEVPATSAAPFDVGSVRSAFLRLEEMTSGAQPKMASTITSS